MAQSAHARRTQGTKWLEKVTGLPRVLYTSSIIRIYPEDRSKLLSHLELEDCMLKVMKRRV